MHYAVLLGARYATCGASRILKATEVDVNPLHSGDTEAVRCWLPAQGYTPAKRQPLSRLPRTYHDPEEVCPSAGPGTSFLCLQERHPLPGRASAQGVAASSKS